MISGSGYSGQFIHRNGTESPVISLTMLHCNVTVSYACVIHALIVGIMFQTVAVVTTWAICRCLIPLLLTFHHPATLL
jgi:hypothetical protein